MYKGSIPETQPDIDCTGTLPSDKLQGGSCIETEAYFEADPIWEHSAVASSLVRISVWWRVVERQQSKSASDNVSDRSKHFPSDNIRIGNQQYFSASGSLLINRKVPVVPFRIFQMLDNPGCRSPSP